MKRPKSVGDGFEPWEVLFDLVMYHPDLMHFAVNALVCVNAGLTWKVNIFSRSILQKKRHLNIARYGGGELLTRGEPYLPTKDVGKAFGNMPRNLMEAMFPKLFEVQLQYVQNNFMLDQGGFYSINLEGVDASQTAWQETCEILVRYADLPINIEIKENTRLSIPAMKDLAGICKQTGFRIYIDDLGSSYHDIGRDVQEKKSYLIGLIMILNQHIKAVKVDFALMRKIAHHWPTFEKVRDNLEAFAWYWHGHCERSLPMVIFEGFDELPNDRLLWLENLEQLAQNFSGCVYQSEKIS